MDASSLAKGGVQPSIPSAKTTIESSAQLQKLVRWHDLKRRHKAVVKELEELNEELFGRGYRP